MKTLAFYMANAGEIYFHKSLWGHGELRLGTGMEEKSTHE
jgi:hypothetical protein